MQLAKALMALALVASPALAAKRHAKGYHCEKKGSVDASLDSRKKCKQAGGKWTRGGEAPAVPAGDEEESAASGGATPTATAATTATTTATATSTATGATK